MLTSQQSQQNDTDNFLFMLLMKSNVLYQKLVIVFKNKEKKYFWLNLTEAESKSFILMGHK